ncbi:MAG: hypothetical protein WB721_26305, partial [Pseudolabrys sp.]
DVRVDGERLEGVGVVPTIEVRADPASVGLSDPQLDRAIAVLSGVSTAVGIQATAAEQKQASSSSVEAAREARFSIAP